MNNIKHPFIQIAGVCLILAPLVMFAADLLLITTNLMFEWSIVLWLSMVLFVPAILGLTFILFQNGSRPALFGGISAFFGAIAGASMQVLFRVYAVLIERGAEQTVEMLRGTFKLIAATQMIGIFFPIGLIMLAVSLYRSRLVNSFIPLLLVIGAILFPIGRIGGFTAAVLGSGVFLFASFANIGWQILSNRQTSAAYAEGSFAEVK